MPVGDLLNWDFLFPQYTDKQREEILRELKKKALHQQKVWKEKED